MNVTNAYLAGRTICKTSPLYQYDYGQLLRFIGIDLPEAYEVHFSNQPHGIATTQIGNADGVTIPDIYLTTGYPVYAWVYLHTGADDGETEYMVTIPVIPRASISNAPPTPVQQDAITEAIAALNTAVGEAETAASHYPKVEDGYWYVWDVTSGEYVSTGVQAQGPQGQQGPPGNVSDVKINGTSIVENSIANILVATVEETQEIITNYGEDDGMVVEMEFVNVGGGTAYYESVSNVSDIATAYKSGKNVVFHFPAQTGYCPYDIYESMSSYIPEKIDGNSVLHQETIYLSFGENSYQGDTLPFGTVSIVNNKLRVSIYID